MNAVVVGEFGVNCMQGAVHEQFDGANSSTCGTIEKSCESGFVPQ